ncbi:zinc-binding dehydrogenase [Alphaproteobacteria bacterium]|nr:zinc-binding dehydrogenase [Alphaproteobacteria bacterium]
MRAMVLTEHGGLDKLVMDVNYPDPKPGEGQVVIKVGACSLNYHDVFTVRGMPGIKVPVPVIIGLDVAGEVAELGPGVSGWSVGDRVLINPIDQKRGLTGEMFDGGLSEYFLASEEQLIRMPDGVSFAQAAALPVAYGTAHRMMFTNGGIKAGDKVMVLGASGGVGTCCVILAKMAGCEVIVGASSEEKIGRLKELGADWGINYIEKAFEKELFAKYGKPHRRSFDGGVDVMVNFTGGDTWVPSLKALKRGGKLLTCGATAGYDPKTDIRYIWTFELKLLGSNSWTVKDLESLMAMIQDGRMDPPIDRIYSLDESGEALRVIEDREVFGKVIVAP